MDETGTGGVVLPFGPPPFHRRGGTAAGRALASGRAAAMGLLAARAAASPEGDLPPGIAALFREVDAWRAALAERHPAHADALLPCVLVEIVGGEVRSVSSSHASRVHVADLDRCAWSSGDGSFLLEIDRRAPATSVGDPAGTARRMGELDASFGACRGVNALMP